MLAAPRQLQLSKAAGFIVLEGLNGAGKTTLQKKILGYLAANGLAGLPTREPGGTPLGQELRRLLLESNKQPSSQAEMFLFAADRAEHIETLIKPALSMGQVVVCDRYYYSSIAFQGYGRQLGAETVAGINAYATRGLEPDFVVLLDLEPEVGLGRLRDRPSSGAGSDSFEAEELAFHRRIRKGFLELAHTSETPFLLLDATKDPEAIFYELSPALAHWLSIYSGKAQGPA